MFEKINLQLFAADTTTHVNVTTDTRSGDYKPMEANSLSPEMKTFYDMTLIDEASAQLVHDQFLHLLIFDVIHRYSDADVLWHISIKY